MFCGVACITGGLLGFGGRVLCASILRFVNAERELGEKGYYEETMKSGDLDPDERSAKRRRLEREGRVKFDELYQYVSVPL